MFDAYYNIVDKGRTFYNIVVQRKPGLSFTPRLILRLVIPTPNYFLQTTRPIIMNGKAANAYAISLFNNPFKAIPRLRKTAIIAAMAPTLIAFSMRFTYLSKRNLIERIGIIKEHIAMQLEYNAIRRTKRLKRLKFSGVLVAIFSRNAKSMPEKDVNIEVSIRVPEGF